MQVKELIINVPWGHLSAKAWGDETDPIVLAFHGLMDNAGSFDRLIPLLPKQFYYVSFDLPGHGKSSHFPAFFPIYSVNNIIAYKLIAQHFDRKRYIIMGHSYGGQLGYLFAQIYPEYVEKLIMLDTVHLYPVSIGQFSSYLRDKFDFCLDQYERTEGRTRPGYSKEVALHKLQNQRFTGVISEQAAKALAERALEEGADGKWRFTVDSRTKNFVNPIHDFNYIIATIRKAPVRCPILIMFADKSDLQYIYFMKVIKEMKKMKNVRMKTVPGTHDVHNNNPEIVAPYVCKFLLERSAKL